VSGVADLEAPPPDRSAAAIGPNPAPTNRPEGASAPIRPTQAPEPLRRANPWRRISRSLSPGLVLAGVASLVYVLVLGFLALAKYSTFHATFEDLGIENQALWLLSHGGIPGYYSSGFAAIYPLQYQKPIMFLVLPFYAIDPHPETLLIIASLVLGGAALPLFLTARRWLRRESYALVVVLAYLLYFPVASANLFDFHYEDLFPLAFFTMTWCYSSGRLRGMYLAAVLTAAVNPLALFTAIAFLLFTCLPGPREPIGLWWVRSAWRSFLSDYRKPVVVFALLVLVGVYAAAGVLFTAGVGGHGTGASSEGILLGYVNDKLLLLVLLGGGLAFLPLYSPRGLVTVLPYLGFVAYSLDSANYQPFGLMYPLLGTGPLFLAAIDGLRSADPEPRPPTYEAPQDLEQREPALANAPPGRPHARRRVSERGAMVRSLLLASVVFGLVFFPISPINSYVVGGYFSGNHDFANITQSTPATAFLNQVVALVPENASVLTQNNIPQLSGREHVQTAPLYQASIPYDAIVMDSSLTYFSSVTSMLPFVDGAFENGTFGVVAEGQGALYLQQGFLGPPELFAPVDDNFSGSELTPFAAAVNGSELVGSGPSYSLWYGPYLTLFPGTYTCTFLVESNTTLASLGVALTLDVTSNDGADTLASESVYPANFTAAGHPTEFQLSFNASEVTTDVELRGMYPTGVATITLVDIALVQTSYLP
jgi:uncharacterized membrane protein